MMKSSTRLLPPKNNLRVINTYGACARGGGKRSGYEARVGSLPLANNTCPRVPRLSTLVPFYQSVTRTVSVVCRAYPFLGVSTVLYSMTLKFVACEHSVENEGKVWMYYINQRYM